MFNLFKKKGNPLLAIANGEVISIEKVEDAVFSQKLMGDGYGLVPTDNHIYSPCNGTIVQVFKTKHAVIIESTDGLELIVHVGLDTVELEGQGFDVKVTDGQEIKAGELLMIADFEYIKSQGKGITVPVVITNMDKIQSLTVNEGSVNHGDEAVSYR